MNFQHEDALKFLRTLPANSVDVVITDPPYGTTQLTWDRFEHWPQWWQEIRRVTKPTAPIVLFGAGLFTVDVIQSARDIYRYRLVWEKTAPVGFLDANRKPLVVHEDIMVFCQSGYGTYHPQKSYGHAHKASKGGPADHYNDVSRTPYNNQDGSRFPTSVLKFSNPDSKLHPTQKPVDLMRWLIRTYSNTSAVVLDPFSGSGSTGVAAIIEGRQFWGCELDSGYYEVAKKRLETTPAGLFSHL